MIELDPDLKRGTVITIMDNGRPVRGCVHAINQTTVHYRAAEDDMGTTPVFVVKLADEGITWARGHNADVCVSLRAAYNLSEPS